MNEKGSIAAKLNVAREELLDLGLRNPLLNYRTFKARGLEIANEKPSDVYRILVSDKKKMTFLEASEKVPALKSVEPPPTEGSYSDEPDELEAAKAYLDSKLQTNYNETQLQNRLLATFTAAKTYIEEQGVNVLYMALGMLNWYDSDQSQEARKAPLLLVPVQLDRVSARERFTVTYTEDEIGHNISLVAKMKAEFGIEIPVFDEDSMTVNEYFEKVKESVEAQKRWSMDHDSIVIGFFSFGKFLMYWDLDVEHWPDHTKPLDHAVLKALLEDGFREPSSAFRDDESLDPHINYEDSNLIKDADSSQLLAVLDANRGRNLVIQGPPGTGKSQTITNLIADAIGHGKKVLFVSEKMAALEVVKRRLDEAGLGIACLELHSHKTNKKLLLNDLANTLQLGEPNKEIRSQIAVLEDLRSRLNRYSESMNTPVGSSGVTPYKALGELVQYQANMKEIEFPRVQSDGMTEWTEETFLKREALMEELQGLIGRMGVPTDHLFWGSRKKVVVPGEADLLRKAAETAAAKCSDLIRQCGNIAENTPAPAPLHLDEARRFLDIARRALHAPKLMEVNIASDKWLNLKDNLHRFVASGASYAAIRAKYDEAVLPAAWDQDVMDIRYALLAYQDQWWRFLSGRYRSAKNKVKALLRNPKAKNESDLTIVDAILEAQSSRSIVMDGETLARELFPSYWNGMKTDWNALQRLIDWMVELHQSVSGRLQSWAVAFLSGAEQLPNLNQLVSEVEQASDACLKSLTVLTEMLEFDGALRFEDKQPLHKQKFTDLHDLVKQWAERADAIHEMTSFNHIVACCGKEELREFAVLAESWSLSSDYLTDCLRWNRYRKLVEKAFMEREALAHFDGSRHDQVVKKFRELDKELILLNRLKLTLAHWNKLPRHEGGGQLGILQREMAKKTRHMPIRKLMQSAGNAIQAIKPVFMMGPLSIATFIPPGSLEFDLVIFDEASQVKPVDAFGAIIRGKQSVVVGDSKQMPPTNFFDSMSKDDTAEDDDFVSDMESILGLFVGQNAPQRMLRWHYRSRHESLITVSNHEFYDDKLVVFPSPDAEKLDSGLLYRYLPETWYDRGRTRTNKLEAKAVALAVMRHAKHSPGLSLGVAAFSMAQMQAVMDEVELLRRADQEAEPFFHKHAHEPFFVKNLENVQGDERDVIFISIGYGKTKEGYLAMDFGPLNREGGERRLNVLVTRARIRCEVFTNLKPEDIDLNRSGARGVKALKTFLNYADKGHLDIPAETGKDFDSPFEEAVYRSITNAGYIVQKQVGSAGFFVDLAVVDPEQPGRYVLGIECDGAAYHSARSARDRDRLRQEVLEGLGWSIHRIWSTGWFKQPERELKRVVEAIEQAKLVSKVTVRSRKPEIEKSAERKPDIRRDPIEAVKPKENDILKYVHADLSIDLSGKEFHTIPTLTIASWVQEVVRVEAPVHISEVIKRICEAAGIKRAGNRIQAAIDEAVRSLEKQRAVQRLNDFLWLPGTQEVPLRNRADMSNKKAGLIDPREVEAAITKVVSESFGISKDDISQHVSQLFGFSRLTEDMRSYTEKVLAEMTSSNKLHDRDGQLIKA
ncbi:DUF3320 domain-containing protein [Paenibacillus silvisoli]|uniref:DUF3320 domain-containing protein n=1 Tax=Paenibacillus silvisoli TaxID=3110539 RepID=UPI0028041F46|nr:DUF3320 domain-containing protein [Paenibacillus silvisoli]